MESVIPNMEKAEENLRNAQIEFGERNCGA